MPTVPTNKLERELRAQYLRWLAGLDKADDIPAYIDKFQRDSTALIAKLGGQAASYGALADFPVPKLLTLSPVAGVVYDDMKQAAIQAGIQAGLNSRDVARTMLNAGLDKSYRKLERLARTETVSAYWKNSWDSVAELPLIVMLWGSESSNKTCQYCQSRDGLVVEDGNIRDHPNGRCTLIPTLRSQVEYKGTLSPDGSVFMDPKWAPQRVTGAKAQVSAGPTTAEQRDPLSGKSNPAAPSKALPAQASAPRPPAPTPQATPTVKTLASLVDPKVTAAKIKDRDWRFIEDRQQRAAVLLQNEYQSEQAVKKMAQAIRETGSTKGVKVDADWARRFTKYSDEASTSYSTANVRDALEDAARWLLDQEAPTQRVLYKGLKVPRDKMDGIFKPGAVFDANFSSFSAEESVARAYAGGQSNKNVIIRVKKAQAVPVNGNPTPGQWKSHKEMLVSGQGHITKVQDLGRTLYVDVEF